MEWQMCVAREQRDCVCSQGLPCPANPIWLNGQGSTLNILSNDFEGWQICGRQQKHSYSSSYVLTYLFRFHARKHYSSAVHLLGPGQCQQDQCQLSHVESMSVGSWSNMGTWPSRMHDERPGASREHQGPADGTRFQTWLRSDSSKPASLLHWSSVLCLLAVSCAMFEDYLIISVILPVLLFKNVFFSCFESLPVQR